MSGDVIFDGWRFDLEEARSYSEGVIGCDADDCVCEVVFVRGGDPRRQEGWYWAGGEGDPACIVQLRAWQPMPAPPKAVSPKMADALTEADAIVDVGLLRSDNTDYLRIAVERKGEPLRRYRISRGLAEGLWADLGVLLYAGDANKVEAFRCALPRPLYGIAVGELSDAEIRTVLETVERTSEIVKRAKPEDIHHPDWRSEGGRSLQEILDDGDIL